MNAQWATAIVAAAGLAGNLVWTLINLRIENKLLTRIDELKDWCDSRYEPKASVPIRIAVRPNGAI